MPTGAKSFRYQYRLNGKRERATIGSYPSMPLKVARIRHAMMLEKVHLGGSPAHAKREARLQAAAGLDPNVSFGSSPAAACSRASRLACAGDPPRWTFSSIVACLMRQTFSGIAG